MSSYDLFGRSAVLRERALAEGAFASVQLEQEILRLADRAEFQLGFEMLLHSNLEMVRSKARMHKHLQALDCFDAAIRRLEAESGDTQLARGRAARRRAT